MERKRASFGNDERDERVISCVTRPNGLYDVTTESAGIRCTYLNVASRLEVGADVTAPIRARLVLVTGRHWSPWDGIRDDD